MVINKKIYILVVKEYINMGKTLIFSEYMATTKLFSRCFFLVNQWFKPLFPLIGVLQCFDMGSILGRKALTNNHGFTSLWINKPFFPPFL
jgi:hypothetical protein